MINSRTALVVGASRGIGLAITQLLLHEKGIQRVYASLRQPDTAAGLLNIKDERLHTIKADLTSHEDLQGIAADIRANGDHPDFVINSAGILHEHELQPEKALNQCHQDSLMRMFQVNSIGPGTTDTSLSRPFQANVRPGKLYMASQSATRIVKEVSAAKADQSGHFINWDGKPIPW